MTTTSVFEDSMTRFHPGSVALVTGAAGDIGRAVAIRLVSEGTSVVAVDLPTASQRLDETVRLCLENAPNAGMTVSSAHFDVTNEAEVESTVNHITQDHGPIDLLFNNAGYQGEFANTIDSSFAEFGRVLSINVTGVFAVLRAFARELRASGKPGAVLNTASMAGVGGAPNMAAYSASKGAVIALTKSAAKDLAPFGIRVNSISPAFIGPGAMWDNQVRRQAEVPSIYYADSDDAVAQQMISQVPLRRYGSLEEVAAGATFLLSNDASYLTGVNLEIAGGAS